MGRIELKKLSRYSNLCDGGQIFGSHDAGSPWFF